ncbi:hypothetical protein [Pirellulimonas nuda]|uniref:hypothetical protein n=1 Tax=Pirellulimonas nuda TaxID=2528009 RepID=UPI0011A5E8E5|nr:hypothetical protein [Pirellulimonas nuda]
MEFDMLARICWTIAVAGGFMSCSGQAAAAEGLEAAGDAGELGESLQLLGCELSWTPLEYSRYWTPPIGYNPWRTPASFYRDLGVLVVLPIRRPATDPAFSSAASGPGDPLHITAPDPGASRLTLNFRFDAPITENTSPSSEPILSPPKLQFKSGVLAESTTAKWGEEDPAAKTSEFRGIAFCR